MLQMNMLNTLRERDSMYHSTQALANQANQEANANPLRGEKSSNVPADLVEMLMQRYHQALSAYAFRLLNSDETAQDIVQDTWVALYLYIRRQPASWIMHANIRAWLWTVVKNKAINYKKTRQRVGSLDLEIASFVREPCIPSFDYPENTAMREDVQRALYQAIKSLREPLREVIAYRFFYGYSLHEIVQTLDVPLNTVKARLARGKKQLQKLLLENGVECVDLDVWNLKCV